MRRTVLFNLSIAFWCLVVLYAVAALCWGAGQLTIAAMEAL